MCFPQRNMRTLTKINIEKVSSFAEYRSLGGEGNEGVYLWLISRKDCLMYP